MTAIVSLFTWAFSDLSCFAIFIIDIVIAKYFIEMAADALRAFRTTPYYRLLRLKLHRANLSMTSIFASAKRSLSY